jgi:sRNA-binding protein
MTKKTSGWYLLSPEDYNKVFDYLSNKYPKLFIKDEVFVFKKGVNHDIFNDTELKFSKTVIRKFLKLYTEQKKYVELHIENTPRYDLEGNEAGFVTKEDVESLAKKRQEIKKQLAAKKSKKLEQKKYNKTSKERKYNNQDSKVESVSTNNHKSKLGLNIKIGNKNE